MVYVLNGILLKNNELLMWHNYWDDITMVVDMWLSALLKTHRTRPLKSHFYHMQNGNTQPGQRGGRKIKCIQQQVNLTLL